VRAQIYLVGGAVMCLVHGARDSTKNVDAWFTEPATIRSAAKSVDADLGLPEDWLNDAAKAFIPADAGFDRWRRYSHLDRSVADDRTLFAMKCAAARTAEDASDIEFLTRRLGLTSSSEAISIVLAYYPADRLPVRTRLRVSTHPLKRVGGSRRCSMRAVECLAEARALGPGFQAAVNEFLDSFRRADPSGKEEMVRDPIVESGPLEGLVAGALNALCREAGIETPPWASPIYSPEPFFAFPARSFALRVRLMVESPPPFRIRNVFVPENYIARA
jgi:hypothetical protein